MYFIFLHIPGSFDDDAFGGAITVKKPLIVFAAKAFLLGCVAAFHCLL
jgi:hypothetical protein